MLPKEIVSFQQNLRVRTQSELEAECLLHMAGNGISFKGVLQVDGKCHRFSIDKNRSKKDEWYFAQTWDFQGRPYFACSYGSWSNQDQKYRYESWSETELSFMTKEEGEQLRQYRKEREKLAEEEKCQRQEEAAQEANEIWKAAIREPVTEGHTAYLKIKKLKSHGYGMRFGKNEQGFDSLIIPLWNINREIRSLQFISVGQDDVVYKSFLTGGEKKGCFGIIGDLKTAKRFDVAEGFATAASAYESKADPVVITIDCGNIDPVLSILRKEYPKHKITIIGDDDVEAPENPGRKKAEEAAKRHRCNVLFPKFQDGWKLPNGEAPTDFNDLHAYFGLDEIKRQLRRKGRLNPIDISDLLQREIPQKKVVLSPWLREKDLGMIYAPRGLGKTWFALGVGYAIASGGRFIKYEALEPRRVLYIDGEMPAVVMQERLARISQQSEQGPKESSYFRIVTYDLEESGIRDLGTKEGREDINVLIDDFDVLILDNLSCLVRSGSENEAEGWVDIQEWMLYLRKMGKVVLIIHHAGKAGLQRGTSKREDTLDVVIALKRPKDYSPSEGARFEVHYEKNRSFTGIDAKPFEARLIDESIGYEWKFKDVEGRDKEEAFTLYTEDKLTMSEIAIQLGVNKSTVSRWIKNAHS